MGGTYQNMTDEQFRQSKFGQWQKAEEKLHTAMTGLRRNVPFFSVQILQKPLKLAWEVSTLFTNGKNIKVGVKWILDTSMWEVESGLVHEKFHDNLLHYMRRGNRDFETFNEAADIVVNYNMRQAGFQIGADWLYDEHLGKLNVHQVYEVLWARKQEEAKNQKEPPPQPEQGPPSQGQGPPQPGQGHPQPGQGHPQPGQGQGQTNTTPQKTKYFGEVQDMPSGQGEDIAPSEEEIRAAEQDEKMSMTIAMNTAKRMGKLPGHLERIVTVRIKGELSWREAVASWCAVNKFDDYSWKRPNSKYVLYGYYLPTLHNEVIDNILVFCDTSGSINQKMLTEMISDIHELMSTFNIQNMKVGYVDSELYQPLEEWSVDSECKPNPVGGGGTDFRPGFTWVKENDEHPVGIIYLTDGQCSRFPLEEPDCPVCWVIIDGMTEDFKPPFGECVYRHLG